MYALIVAHTLTRICGEIKVVYATFYGKNDFHTSQAYRFSIVISIKILKRVPFLVPPSQTFTAKTLLATSRRYYHPHASPTFHFLKENSTHWASFQEPLLYRSLPRGCSLKYHIPELEVHILSILHISNFSLPTFTFISHKPFRKPLSWMALRSYIGGIYFFFCVPCTF